jgi:benzoyl-CoA reductase/2-hydroxyglutaryl-CoA dehydratase subunit BcrC/BadD/HgdB
MEEKPKEKTSAIKALGAAPEATKLMKTLYREVQEAAQAGQPIAWNMVGIEQAVLQAMDIKCLYPEQYSALCAAKQIIIPNLEMAESAGFSPSICSYARNAFGLLHKWKELGAMPPEAANAWGGMPKPTMLLTNTNICDGRYKWLETIATHYWDIPIYCLDYPTLLPYSADFDDEHFVKHYVDYYVDQVKGLVAFLEKHTGKKLNMDKLSEAIENVNRLHRAWQEVYEMRKLSPSPMPSGDYFSCVILFMYFAAAGRGAELVEGLRDEIRERVANKVSIVPEEKFRLLYKSFPLWFDTGLFNYFESLGAVCVVETMYAPGMYYELDPSNPWESMARRHLLLATRDLRSRGTDGGAEGTCGWSLALRLAKEFKVDGMVANTTVSCRVGSLGQLFTADVLRDELHIPSLFIEADLADPRAYSKVGTRLKVDAFMEILSACKEEREKVGLI